jgi:hypothetical protein
MEDLIMATSEENPIDKAQSMGQRISDEVGQAADKVRKMGDRARSKVRDVAEQARSGARNLPVNERTIPDAFRDVPKLISPRVHRWLDVAVTGYFLALGALFSSKGRKGAATAAFINAGMVAGVSALTDYNGDGTKPISFKLHGTLDALQAATAAVAPILHGFADEPEAAFFYGQAGNEVAVIATTDWEAGTSAEQRLKAA